MTNLIRASPPGAAEDQRLNAALLGVLLFAGTLLADAFAAGLVARTGISVARVAGLGMLLLAFGGRFRRAPAVGWFVLWLALAFFGTAVRRSIPSSAANVKYVVTFAQLVVAYQLIFQAVRSRTALVWLSIAFYGGCVLAAIALIIIGQKSETGGLYFPDIFDPGELARHFALAILLASFWAISRHRLNPIWTAAACALFPFMILTGSRGTLLALGAGILVLLVGARWGRGVKWRAVLVLIILMTVGYQTARSGRQEARYESILTGSTAHRGEIATATIEVFKDFPIVGAGLGSTQYLLASQYAPYLSDEVRARIDPSDPRIDPHNTYLFVLADTGLVGFLILAIAIGLVTRLALRARSRRSPYATLSLSIIVFLAVSGTSNTDLLQKYFWLGLGIAAIASGLDSKETAGSEQVSSST